jgi:DNA-directed RNA polymerase alpha subunit
MTDDTDWTGISGLAAPARRALTNAGFTRLAQLTKVSEEKVSELHGMGAKAIEGLRHALAERGLKFGD